MQQLAGVREYVLSDGPGRGVRAMRVYNAAGLELEILADRALDIGRAAWKGIPRAWSPPPGRCIPANTDPGAPAGPGGSGGGGRPRGGRPTSGARELKGTEALG